MSALFDGSLFTNCAVSIACHEYILILKKTRSKREIESQPFDVGV